jgi:GDP-D-mannose dehydratase
MNRKVALITGITGQDGSYLAELLLESRLTCSFLSSKNCFSRLKSLFYPSSCSNKKEKSFENNLVFKAFSYLCLFLLRLRKNEVENYADDGGKTDAGNGEGTG